MGREEYWVAISQGGVLRGAGFFVTRHYVVTAEGCLGGVGLGGEIELRTAQGLALRGYVDEVTEGLALVHVMAAPEADYPTPRADRAVKGDDWYAPYRPSPAHARLSGHVDDVVQGRRSLTVLELAPEEPQAAGRAEEYAGGPVQRHGAGLEAAVLGVLLTADHARELRGGQGCPLAAGDLGAVIDSFDALNPRRLLGLLTDGPPPSTEPSPAAARRARVEDTLDLTELSLRRLKDWARAGLVEEVDLPPYRIELLETVVQTVKGEVARD